MSGPAQAGLFVYAKDLVSMARFYESILGMARLHDTEELVVLQSSEIQLVVHTMPVEFASAIVITSPPQRRVNTALKFFFTVASISAVKSAAPALGGEVYPEQWEGPGFLACNACDPEGNIFQVRERRR